MGTTMKFGKFSVTCKYFRFTQIRRAGYYPTLRLRTIKIPKHLENFPDILQLWSRYSTMKILENNFKAKLLDELITESLNKSYASMHYFAKILFIKSSIGTLMEQNLVPSVNGIVNAMLRHLEKFPFDRNTINQEENDISIKFIRDAIEKQYLVWKYKLNLTDLEEILGRYKHCLYDFRSLSNLRRNISLLETSNLNVTEKIYFLNQQPFNAQSAKDFQNTIAGLQWQLFPQHCPKILRHSHQYILFVISILRKNNFTEKQIQGGLPFLHYGFTNFMRRLNEILTSPQLAKHRDDDKFLYLLSYDPVLLHDLVNSRKASFVELTDMVRVSSKNLTGRVKLTSASAILYHTRQFFNIDRSYVNMIKKHPKYKVVSEKQVLDTIIFLKDKEFSPSELAESITIILYPRSAIEKTLQNILFEEPTLQKYGFENGCVSGETNYFKHGNKEKRKILQLCLYYMEKPYNFSGNGVWESEENCELNTPSTM